MMQDGASLAGDAGNLAELGRDLWSLVCAVPARLTSVTPIIGDHYPGYQPSAFRLQFADGRVLKGRCLQTPAQAETVEYVSRCLEYRGLPRVLGRCDTALLCEWIDGLPLSALMGDRHLLSHCGALQGIAHTVPLPPESPSPPAADSMRVRLECRLEELVELAVLERPFAAKAAHIAGADAPQSCASGFTYGDLCPDNIVQQPSGSLYVVDNETLEIQPYDYDLARTWYRWPMRGDEREAYYDGYREYRPLADFRAHFAYWAIAAIVDGALFRGRRGGAAAAKVPVQRLYALVRGLERGASGEDAAP